MIQSVQRALAILEALSNEPERSTPLSEIAGRVQLKLSTCANILKTLLDLGYVEQERPKGGYKLGPLAYHLTRRGPYRRDLVELALPLMAELAGSVHETVLLAAMSGGRRTTLCRADGNAVFRIREGFLLEEDAYRTATGRLLLAYMSESELRVFLAANGLADDGQWPEAATEGGLARALAAIREEGRAITEDDPAGVAFPVRDGLGVVAALGLYLPRDRFQGAHRKRVLDGMAATAATISRQLKERRHDTDRTGH